MKRYPRDGPKVLVRNDFVSSIDPPSSATKPGVKSARVRRSPNMSTSKNLQSIFMGSIKNHFRYAMSLLLLPCLVVDLD